MAGNILKCNTISDLIEYGNSLDISHSNIHFKSYFINSEGKKIIINYSSLYERYYEYLKNIIKTVKLSNDEYHNYRFQPKRLSFEIYGTAELWSLVLRINNLTSASQFDMQELKLFTMDIFKVLNEILILEADEIKSNREDVGI